MLAINHHIQNACSCEYFIFLYPLQGSSGICASRLHTQFVLLTALFCCLVCRLAEEIAEFNSVPFHLPCALTAYPRNSVSAELKQFSVGLELKQFISRLKGINKGTESYLKGALWV